jgi:hypothetical protein
MTVKQGVPGQLLLAHKVIGFGGQPIGLLTGQLDQDMCLNVLSTFRHKGTKVDTWS